VHEQQSNWLGAAVNSKSRMRRRGIIEILVFSKFILSFKVTNSFNGEDPFFGS
jgi:hypothetical protein